MKAIHFKGQTNVLGKPLDWDDSKDGTCGSLPVLKFEGVIYSYWKPTLLERIKVLLGYKVRLAVAGAYMPPVELTAMKEGT